MKMITKLSIIAGLMATLSLNAQSVIKTAADEDYPDSIKPHTVVSYL